MHLGDGDGRRAGAGESFDSHDLEVEVAVGKAMLGPGSEDVSSGDRARSALGVADSPVLGKGAGAGDRGLVGTGIGAERVGGAIRADGSELGHAGGARVEAAVGLDDVVLGLGRVDPAVDGEVRAAGAGAVGGGVGDGTSMLLDTRPAHIRCLRQTEQIQSTSRDRRQRQCCHST